MKIAVCLDDRDGMLFANRRQSTDRVLRQRFLLCCGDARVWMSNYSVGQFEGMDQNILVDDDFLVKAAAEDWCFVEDKDITPFVDKITQIVVYRWNRHYPSDHQFPTDLFSAHWHLASVEDFAGYSHDRITEEVYYL